MALAEIRTITRVRHPERVVMTSSQSIAYTFDTCHENITDIIDTMFDKTRHEVPLYSKLGFMFEPVSTVDKDGDEQEVYYMNKDGFLLVMMKLTGNGKLEKLNLFWVLEYLAAFNLLQEELIKERYMDEYLAGHPDTRLMVRDILQNASMKGVEKLEAALIYYADYIPDRLHEIYKPEKKKTRYT